MEHGFAIFGMVVAAALLAAVAFVVLFVIVMLAVIHFPRFHVGHPKNIVTLETRSWEQITTAKNGERQEPTEPRLVQKLGVKWWAGISSRNKASWFFGLLSVIRQES